MRVNPTLATAFWNSVELVAKNVWVLRSYVRFTALPTLTSDVLSMVNASGPGAYFNATDSKLYAGYFSVTAQLGATGIAVTTGVWYRVDVRVNASANPWTIDVQVDGEAAGQKTNPVAAALMNTLRLGTAQEAPTADIFYDDIVASNTAADYPLGAGQGWCGVPTADGTHNVAGAADFRRGDTTTDITNATTDAYLLVDEVPLDDVTPDTNDHIRINAPPNAAEYVELVFGPAPGFAAITGTINGVEAIGEVFAAGTGLSDELFQLNDNGTVNTIYDGRGLAGVTTGTYKRKFYATAPSTGVAWTAALVNALRLRYGFATDANPDKSLMCAMLEVDHVPPSVDMPPGLGPSFAEPTERAMSASIWMNH